MSIELLKVGHCFHPEAIVTRGGSWRAQQFPAIVALLKHPQQGYILFDTGYAKHFIQATAPFPQRLYRWVTPMHLCDKENLLQQLAQRGIAPDDIKHIFISHFHADHIAGLLDFPRARYICSRVALQSILQRSGIRGLLKGYLPALLPTDFSERVSFIEDCLARPLAADLAPFGAGYDVFGDGAYIAVELPGHAYGHYGLLCNQLQSTFFLIGDACWTQQALIAATKPHPLASIILSDKTQYYATIDKLAQLYGVNQQLRIIPAHCQSSYDQFLCTQR